MSHGSGFTGGAAARAPSSDGGEALNTTDIHPQDYARRQMPPAHVTVNASPLAPVPPGVVTIH